MAFQRRWVPIRKVPEQNDEHNLRVENSKEMGLFSFARRKARTDMAAIFKYRRTAKKEKR